MLTEEVLKNSLHTKSLTNTDKLLLCLAINVQNPKAVKKIKEIARDNGLRIEKLNVSSLLSHSQGLAISTPNGWELTNSGRLHIFKIAGDQINPPAIIVASQLRKTLPNIKDRITSLFVEEAIHCLESKYFRAAVVLSWVGAISVLYDYVVTNHLIAFNNEALRRDPKWKFAKTRDDFSRMKESDFLDILEAISVLGKSVKLELKKCLGLRNSCGHPNSLIIGENIVAAHIETLILNLFSQY